MKPKDILGIIIRVIGIALFLFSIWYLVGGVALLINPELKPEYHARQYFVSGSIGFILGLYFLRGAPLLLRYCYPDEKETNT